MAASRQIRDLARSVLHFLQKPGIDREGDAG
jgi:hypothetical protein